MTSGKYTVNVQGTLDKAVALLPNQGLRLLVDTFNMPEPVACSLLLDLYEGKKSYKVENNTLILNN